MLSSIVPVSMVSSRSNPLVYREVQVPVSKRELFLLHSLSSSNSNWHKSTQFCSHENVRTLGSHVGAGGSIAWAGPRYLTSKGCLYTDGQMTDSLKGCWISVFRSITYSEMVGKKENWQPSFLLGRWCGSTCAVLGERCWRCSGILVCYKGHSATHEIWGSLYLRMTVC